MKPKGCYRNNLCFFINFCILTYFMTNIYISGNSMFYLVERDNNFPLTFIQHCVCSASIV